MTTLRRARRRSPVKITPEIVEKVEHLATYDICHSQIALRTGISTSSVQRILASPQIFITASIKMS